MAEYTPPIISHPDVIHRDDLLDQGQKLASRINDWGMNHLALVLGSSAGVWLAFAVPLIAFKVPRLLGILGLVSSYWIQLWALFVLQNRANAADRAAKAKADSDHMSQTHMALTLDKVAGKLGV
jgi:hypothetical protein